MSEPHPQHAEVERLLAHLMNSGFVLDEVDDGGDWYPCHNDLPSTRDTILGVEESRLRVRHGDTEDLEILIVLGNGPGELAADYTGLEPLMSAMEKFAAEEYALAEAAEQPADRPELGRFEILFEDRSRTEFDAKDMSEAWEMAPDIVTAHRKRGVLMVSELTTEP